MAYEYSELLGLTNQVINELASQQGAIKRSVASFTEIEDALTHMGVTYAQWVTDIDALAVANPSDPEVTMLKARKDRLVAEFGTAQAKATALKDAVNGV